MGLFSIFKKKTETNGTTNASTTGAATTTVPKREGWWVECEPACGFKVVTHNKNELVSLVQHHMKNTHSKTIAEDEVLKVAKTV